MRHRSLAALVSVLLLATQASSLAAPREDEEYSLISSDGRYLVANGDRLHLVPAEQATIGSAVHTFDFVRVPGSHELVYLRFGETILAAFDADGTSSPKFRLFTRSSPDQRVALLTSSDDVEKSKLSRCLRATPSGSVEQAAFQTSDPSVWWQLKPASARGDESCPSSPPMLGGRARAKPTNVRAASGVVSPARVITTSALTVAAATAAMLPAGVIGAAVPALAVNALGALPQPLAAAAASAGEVIKGTFGLLRQNQMAAVAPAFSPTASPTSSRRPLQRAKTARCASIGGERAAPPPSPSSATISRLSSGRSSYGTRSRSSSRRSRRHRSCRRGWRPLSPRRSASLC